MMKTKIPLHEILSAIIIIIFSIIFYAKYCFSETLVIMDNIKDNETAFIEGVVSLKGAEHIKIEGAEILLCELRCAECVFEGLAITNSEGKYNFPNLNGKMYRLKVLGWDDVQPLTWTVIYKRAE